MREVRGKKISMILHDPMTSLKPVYMVGEQIDESIRLQRGLFYYFINLISYDEKTVDFSSRVTYIGAVVQIVCKN